MKQQTFTSLASNTKKKQTRREKLLAEMEIIVPWRALESLIEPYYHKAGKRGGQPKSLSMMLRIYFMQQWYALSDPGMEDSLYDIELMRRFAGIVLGEDAVPDETTILNFRRLLERHNLTTKLMEVSYDTLANKGIFLKGGTMLDATIIHAQTANKNKNQTRDPQIHSTRKGNQ